MKIKAMVDSASRAFYVRVTSSMGLPVAAGSAILLFGLSKELRAFELFPDLGGGGGGGGGNGLAADTQIIYGLCAILTLPEGAWGALVMAVAGVIAVVSAAMGMYKSAIGTVVVGCGAWLIRPLISLFFGDINCDTFTFAPRAPSA